MKKAITKSFIIGGSLLASFFTWFLNQSEKSVYSTRSELATEQGWHGAYEYLKSIRSDAKTGTFNHAAYLKAVNELNERRTMKAGEGEIGLNWIEMGPDNIGGRTRAITVDKDDPNHLWAGAASGGLWESFDAGNNWQRVIGFKDNLVIGSMDQMGNGNLVVGTGSKFEGATGSDLSSAGFLGNGVYISRDGGATFEHVVANGDTLKPDVRHQRSEDWVRINELAADPNDPNKIWIAHNDGLQVYNDAANSLETPEGLPGIEADDVQLSSDGNVIIASISNTPYLSVDGGNSFENISDRLELPFTTSRVEFAISPDDANFIYALVSEFRNEGSRLQNVYGSDDKGLTWQVVVPGSVPEYDPFGGNGQGFYDNVISVIPGRPGEAVMGGVTLWKVGLETQPEQIALNFAGNGHPLYVHSDIHEFTWSPDGTLYIGTDGGIHKSTDKGKSFVQANRGYNVSQFYDISYSNDGKVLGGTQDNGTLYLHQEGVTELSAANIIGGDGFDNVISQLNSDIMIGSVQGADFRRSNEDGINFGAFTGSAGCVGGSCGSFVSTCAMFENPFDNNSQSMAVFTNTTIDTLYAGDEVTVKSSTQGLTFRGVVQSDSLFPAEEEFFVDPFTHIFAMSFSSGLWISREAIHFGKQPEFIRIANFSPNEIVFGPEGRLYAAVGQAVYRINNVADVWDQASGSIDSTNRVTDTRLIYNSNNVVTGIAVDPNNPNHVVITRGNYNTSSHVLETFNALDDNPNFTSIQGDLPDFPVYDAEIDMFNPNLIVIGTEMGVFATEDGQSWSEENNGLDRVPAFDVEQQAWHAGLGVANTGIYYVGTYGRGAFRAENFQTNIAERGARMAVAKVFPNPAVSDVTIEVPGLDNQNAVVNIYNINGRKVNAQTIAVRNGALQMSVASLSSGNYLIQVVAGSGKYSAKFVKQ